MSCRYVMEVCEQTNAAPFVTVELVRQTNVCTLRVVHRCVKLMVEQSRQIKFLSGMRRHFAEVSV